MGEQPVLTERTLGCWLIKGNRERYPVDDLVKSGFGSVTGWSLHPTRRTALIKASQPVLFWISGNDPVHPAGIYAQGTTRGAAERAPADDRWIEEDERGKTKTFMPVKLRGLRSPILRSDLLEHPVLSQIEVIRMPGGSNPSFLSPDQYATLRGLRPEVR